MAKWLRRIGGALLALLVISIAVFSFLISRNAPCGQPVATAGSASTIRAVMRRCYGPPEVLTVEQVVKPVPADDQMLVRVRAAGINPVEWHTVRGEPYIMRIGAGFGTPSDPHLGNDFSGTVETVGRKVSRFKPGDEIFGGRSGALAEYVLVKETGSIALKPANISFEQAGATN